jgi:hypothetical protein
MSAARLALCVLAVTVLHLASAPMRAGNETANPPAAPLTNEDIVRMVAAGEPDRDIVAAIASRAEAFDLSDDMVDELKLAGVSAPILAAMRQKRSESAPPSPPPERPARGSVPLVVTLNAGGAGSRTLKTPAWADEEWKARLMLPKENDQRVVKDLAIFLACGSAEHIPDLWRSKSPLGQDMVSVARHEMLVFVPGETPAGQTPRLTLPARIEASVDGNETHDIILGVAARIGDRWMQLAAERLPNVTVSADSKPLAGRIKRVGREFDFEVELTAGR